MTISPISPIPISPSSLASPIAIQEGTKPEPIKDDSSFTLSDVEDLDTDKLLASLTEQDLRNGLNQDLKYTDDELSQLMDLNDEKPPLPSASEEKKKVKLKKK